MTFLAFLLSLIVIGLTTPVEGCNDNFEEFKLEGYWNKTQNLIEVKEGFCWINHVSTRSFHLGSEPEYCQVRIDSGVWRMNYFGATGTSACTVLCTKGCNSQHSIQTQGGGNVVEFRGSFGQSHTARQLSELCFLTQHQGVFHRERWLLWKDHTGHWNFEAWSGEGSFAVGIMCVDFPNRKKYPSVTAIGNRGFYPNALLNTQAGPGVLCFLSLTAGLLYDDQGQCNVHIEKGWWVISGIGRGPECQAQCFNLNLNVYDGNMHGKWYLAGENSRGGITKSISVGTSRSEGNSVTTEFSTAFTAGVEAGIEFFKGGASFGIQTSTTAAQSIAESISREVTQSVTYSETGSCDAGRGNLTHVYLYQWFVQGKNRRNLDDVVFSAKYRCHYTAGDHIKPDPQCPHGYCGDGTNNPLCELSKCIKWQN